MGIDMRRLVGITNREIADRIDGFDVQIECPYAPGGIHVVRWRRGALSFECPVPVAAEAMLRREARLPLAGCSGFLTAWRQGITHSNHMIRSVSAEFLGTINPIVMSYITDLCRWRTLRNQSRDNDRDPLVNSGGLPGLYSRFRKVGKAALAAALENISGVAPYVNGVVANHHGSRTTVRLRAGRLSVATDTITWLHTIARPGLAIVRGLPRHKNDEHTTILVTAKPSRTRRRNLVVGNILDVLSDWHNPRLRRALIDPESRSVLEWV